VLLLCRTDAPGYTGVTLGGLALPFCHPATPPSPPYATVKALRGMLPTAARRSGLKQVTAGGFVVEAVGGPLNPFMPAAAAVKFRCGRCVERFGFFARTLPHLSRFLPFVVVGGSCG